MQNLDRDDLDYLEALLVRQPDYQNAARRFDFFQNVFAETDRQWDIIGLLDMDGAASLAARDTLHKLVNFGQIAPGVEALAPLVEELQHRYRSDGAISDHLKDLHRRNALRGSGATTEIPLAKRWKGDELTDRAAIVHLEEKIIGEDTFQDVAVLERAFRAAASVLMVQLQAGGGGTGFLVAPHLVMTNNHVIASRAEAEKAIFRFNYQLTPEGTLCPVSETRFVSGGLFHTNPNMDAFDYTLLEITPAPDFQNPLSLSRKVLRKDDRVPIIQHPNGNVKKIAMRENYVAYADTAILQYYTATEPGSSGSPVFNERFEVVGLHHRGGMIEEPGSKRRYFRNEGIAMAAILDDLRQNATHIYDLLTLV